MGSTDPDPNVPSPQPPHALHSLSRPSSSHVESFARLSPQYPYNDQTVTHPRGQPRQKNNLHLLDRPAHRHPPDRHPRKLRQYHASHPAPKLYVRQVESKATASNTNCQFPNAPAPYAGTLYCADFFTQNATGEILLGWGPANQYALQYLEIIPNSLTTPLSTIPITSLQR